MVHHQPRAEVAQDEHCAADPNRAPAQALFSTHLQTQWTLLHFACSTAPGVQRGGVSKGHLFRRGSTGCSQTCQLATASPWCRDRVKTHPSPGSEGCNCPRGKSPPSAGPGTLAAPIYRRHSRLVSSTAVCPSVRANVSVSVSDFYRSINE